MAPGSILPTNISKESMATSPPDLLSKFIQAKIDRPEFMTDSLVMTMAVSMAFAGSETTASSLSAVFYYLLKNPRCMQKLLNELDSRAREGYFRDNDKGLVTWSESQGLPYLDACIKEAFRLHPAAGLPLERVVPPQGAEIAGTFVKGGTIVGCSAWVIHRRKEIFGEDVDVFRPERWLVGQGREGVLDDKERNAEEKRIKEMSSVMLHFGMGSRTCIGKNISLLEIYKLVPAVLRRFEVCFLSILRTSNSAFSNFLPFGSPRLEILTPEQVNLEHPDLEWKLHNAWFVRQLNFHTTFTRRELVKPIS
jgi:cytochrome P450